MGAVHAGQAGATAGSGWGAAWRARAGNPLPRLWHVTAQRRAEGKPWWGRSPGLLLCGVLISALTTWLLWLALLDFLGVRHSAVASRAAALGYLGAGTAVLLAGALLLCLFWLLGRVYSAAHLSLSLLAEGKPSSGETLDRLVGASGLSDSEIVLGLLMHTWRLLAPPLIAVSVLQALLCAVAVLTDAATRAPAWLIGSVLLGATALCAAQLASGLAAGLAAVLLLMLLGRGLRAPLVPALGAAGVALAQLLCIGLGTVAAAHRIDQPLMRSNVPLTALALIGGVLLLRLAAGAQPWRSARMALLYAWPVLALVLFMQPAFAPQDWVPQGAGVAVAEQTALHYALLPLRLLSPQLMLTAISTAATPGTEMSYHLSISRRVAAAAAKTSSMSFDQAPAAQSALGDIWALAASTTAETVRAWLIALYQWCAVLLLAWPAKQAVRRWQGDMT